MAQKTYCKQEFLESLKRVNSNLVIDCLPFDKNNFVKIPIRTKEQATYAAKLGKTIYSETITINGHKFEHFFCLMPYQTAIDNSF